VSINSEEVHEKDVKRIATELKQQVSQHYDDQVE
jgi:hypothetical protein